MCRGRSGLPNFTAALNEQSARPPDRLLVSVRSTEPIPWEVNSRNRKPALAVICGARDWLCNPPVRAAGY